MDIVEWEQPSGWIMSQYPSDGGLRSKLQERARPYHCSAASVKITKWSMRSSQRPAGADRGSQSESMRSSCHGQDSEAAKAFVERMEQVVEVPHYFSVDLHAELLAKFLGISGGAILPHNSTPTSHSWISKGKWSITHCEKGGAFEAAIKMVCFRVWRAGDVGRAITVCSGAQRKWIC